MMAAATRAARPFDFGGKPWQAAVRGAARASGWKQKTGALFRQEEDWFVAGHARNRRVGGEWVPHAEIMAKPMALDPLLWRDMGHPENADEPLSFRLWGAFVCGTPVLDARPLPPVEDADAGASALVGALDAMLPGLMTRLATHRFSDLAKEPAGIHDNWRMEETIMYALLLEKDTDAATATARDLLSQGRGGTWTLRPRDDGDFDSVPLAQVVLDRLDPSTPPVPEAPQAPATRGWLSRLMGRRM